MLLRNTIGFCFVIVTSSLQAIAAPRSFSTENQWNSSAISGLGGSGLLSPDFVDRTMTNAALTPLGKRTLIIQWASAHVTYSKGLAEGVSTIDDVKTSSGTDSQMVDTLGKVKSLFGKRLTGGANAALLAVRVNNFSFIPYTSALLTGDARIPSWPQAQAVADAYGGVALGMSVPLGASLDLGATVRPGTRFYGMFSASASTVGRDLTGDTTTEKQELFRKGTGTYLPLDLGANWKPLQTWEFSLAGRNIGDASATSHSETKPPPYRMHLATGATWHFLQRGNNGMSLGTELQDVGHLDDSTDLWLRWQWFAQYRYNLPGRTDTTLAVHTGLQSGYPAIGLLIDLFILKAEATYYAVESGYRAGQRPEERYSFKIYSQLSF